jgi:hypothetical protein
MKKMLITALVLVFGLGMMPIFAGDSDKYELSGPYTHKNFSIYIIYGAAKKNGAKIMTLQEALAAKIAVVHETEDVNRLQITNRSNEYDIFIMSGDIVKGGKQDRTVQYTCIIPAKTKRMDINSFCVEQGRWEKRGKEDSSSFKSSDNMIASKELKMSVRKEQSQGKVWTSVEKMQKKLGDNLGEEVKSVESESSLQLTLENKRLKMSEEEYYRRLGPVVLKKKDAVGFVFVINGSINSAEVFVTSDLFRRVWGKCVRAGIQEAISVYQDNARFDNPAPSEIRSFLKNAENGSGSTKKITDKLRVVEKETDSELYFETRSDGQWVNKSYMTK